MTQETDQLQRPRLRLRRSLANKATSSLRYMIMLGKLKPGDTLSEPELAKVICTSRTPIREALRVLASEGLVELRHGRKAVVTGLDRQEMRHLFEVETLLEAQAARLAALRMSDAALETLGDLQIKMEHLASRGRRKDYVRINQQAHRMIVEAAANPELSKAHAQVFVRLERARNLALTTPGRTDESLLEHRLLLDALKARDSAEASRIAEVHKLRTAELYLDDPLIFPP